VFHAGIGQRFHSVNLRALHHRLLPLSVLLFAMPVWAHNAGHEPGNHERAYRLKQSGEILSLEEILRRARTQHDGKILDADLVGGQQQFIYEIEIVDPHGYVWEMNFDAKTGSLLKTELEN
jgi:uncharacterized membrane protein YkoI